MRRMIYRILKKPRELILYIFIKVIS